MKKLNGIIKILKSRIETQQYVPGIRMPSEAELADDLGVNRITLNHAVNALIAEGWLVRGKSSRDGTYVRDRSSIPLGSLGLFTHCGSSYSFDLLHGVMDGAVRGNYLLCTMSPNPRDLFFAYRKMVSGGVKGLVVAGYGDLVIPNPEIPIIYADGIPSEEREDRFVLPDMGRGAEDLADYFVRTGNGEIVFCYSSGFGMERNPRIARFRKQMDCHGISRVPERFFYSNSLTFRQLLQKIFTAFPSVSAIVGETDEMTYQLIVEVRKSFPDRYSNLRFGGFGNLREIQQIHPFPTVDQHPYEIGSRAVELLILPENDSADRVEYIPVHLIVPEDRVPAFFPPEPLL